MMRIKLRGITWDHKRGYDPMIRCTELFMERHPDVVIQWDKRTLQEFGNFPVSRLAEKYDLLVIDHPFSGEAASKKILVNLMEYVTMDRIRDLRENSIGKTFESYVYDGNLMALPIDAAAIVSAVNTSWMEDSRVRLPSSLQDVFLFKQEIPDDKKILIPLCPTDIWCVFLSLCAASSEHDFIDEEDGFDEGIAAQAIQTIRELASISALDPYSLNPIDVLEIMSSDPEYVYSPFLFNYVNYSRKGEHDILISFNDAPLTAAGKPKTILGGAGIAVSAQSEHIQEAVMFAEFISSPEIQASDYYSYGGQPSHQSAWDSMKNNADSTNFFANTSATMENAFVRPRLPGWNDFQDEASILLHEGIVKGTDCTDIVAVLNTEYVQRVSMKKDRKEI